MLKSKVEIQLKQKTTMNDYFLTIE